VSSTNEGDHLVKRLNERGDVLWSKGFTGSHGEGTAIAVMTTLNETVGIAFTGHRGDEGTIDGFLTRLNANDGTTVWDKTFGDPAGGVGRFAGLAKGNPILIYDECWSVQATVDGGWVVGCGTGIEGCDLHAAGSAIRRECEADPRTTWRAMVTKFDSTGGFVWRRLDNFSEEGSDDVGPSACEHVALTSDGGLLAVNDEGFGIGLMRLGLQGSEVSPSGGSNSGTVTNTNQTPTQPQTEAQTEMRTIAADSCNAFGQSSSGAGLLLIAFFAVLVRRRTTSASF
jgi:outer membrane protein assembly factor BamB